MVEYEFETPSGKYVVVKPTGKLGAKEWAIISKHIGSIAGKKKLTDKDQEKIAAAFEEWAEKILPHIIIESTIPYEEMPGEDQLLIFNVVVFGDFADKNNVEGLFRFTRK